MRINKKTVFVTEDGKAHDSQEEAQEWIAHCMVRGEIEAADLDWRDGVGEDAATPDKIAAILCKRFVFSERYPDVAGA